MMNPPNKRARLSHPAASLQIGRNESYDVQQLIRALQREDPAALVARQSEPLSIVPPAQRRSAYASAVTPHADLVAHARALGISSAAASLGLSPLRGVSQVAGVGDLAGILSSSAAGPPMLSARSNVASLAFGDSSFSIPLRAVDQLIEQRERALPGVLTGASRGHFPEEYQQVLRQPQLQSGSPSISSLLSSINRAGILEEAITDAAAKSTMLSRTIDQLVEERTQNILRKVLRQGVSGKVQAPSLLAQAPTPASAVARSIISPTLLQQQQQQDQQGLCSRVAKELATNLKESPKSSPRSLVPSLTQTTTAEGDPIIPVALESERGRMSEYQCLFRQQLVFVATNRPKNCGRAQGRTKPISKGQVGLLCKYCAQLPADSRPPGAIYYPAKLGRIYQAAIHMGINHFCNRCPAMPEEVRQELKTLKAKKMADVGFGKSYWADAAKSVGIEESETGLFLDTKEPERTRRPFKKRGFEETVDSPSPTMYRNQQQLSRNGSPSIPMYI